MTAQQQAPPAVDATSANRQPEWSLPLSLFGTLAGAAVGALAFWGLLKYGLYAIMLPGVLAGLGGGYPLKRRVIGVGIFAGVVSVVAMFLVEWWNRPFVVDESLPFFLKHLDQLKT
jgi:hypothetical protein